MNLRLRSARGAALLLCSWSPLAGAEAGSPEPLPEPLTLEYALSLAEEAHPEVELARADLQLARSDLDVADALTGTTISIAGRARWVGPSDVAADQSSEDHAVGLFLRKNLYDFGRSDHRRKAAGAELEGREWLYADAVQRRRIAILEHFVEVLLADLEFTVQDEAMAVVYVALDRLRNRGELGQVSDIDLLEMESDYQRVRRERAAAQGRQRAVRARLAQVLNRPGRLPSALVLPQLDLQRELPEYEEMSAQALASNPLLLALRAQLAAADARVAAVRADYGPKLQGELETSAYTRELGSYDEWRAGVSFEIPLYSGGAKAAAVGREVAQRHRIEAQLRQAEHEVEQAVLDLWLELQTLRVQREEMTTLRDYRELYLDRSRAVYELEVKADLGDAMVRLTEAQLQAARAEFREAVVWERLDALLGGRPERGGELRKASLEGDKP